MNYNIFQKITSFILIFLFFFSITFKIPLYKNIFNFGQTYAENWNKRYNIVSIFVEEKIYPQIKWELSRYAKDISWVLEKTKAVIIPVPEKSSAFAIASLNEKFYYEGYDKDSKLIWTILVWKVPLAVVNDWSANSRTIFPYVDFEDKWFIYNHKTKKYEKNSKLQWKIKPEIWHWVIAPNSSYKSEVKSLKDFFDKDHDFYEWKGIFKKEIGVINWKNWEEVSDDHEPYVFYYDWIRENQSVVYKNYKAYTRYLRNIEDLSYNRFTKKLADTVKDIYSDWWYTKDQKKIIKDLMWVDLNKWVWKIKTEQIPDIHTRRIIQKSVKKFAEIFNSKLFWDVEKNVHNAWRYNKTVVVKKNWKDINQARVNVDTIPEIITKLDEISRLTIKNANTDLEDYIDDLVRNKWVSRYIPLFQRIYVAERKKPILDEFWICTWWNNEDRFYHKNFMYWKMTKTIWEKDYYTSHFLEKEIINKENWAKMCSIYRWSVVEPQLSKVENWEDYTNFNRKGNFYPSKWWFVFWQLVEANRARDVSVKDFEQVENIKDDLKYVFESNEEYIYPVALKRWYKVKYTKLDWTYVDEVAEPDEKRIKSLVNLDLNILKKESNYCLRTLENEDKIGLRGRFWMNSPLYIDSKKIGTESITLIWVWEEHTDLKRSIIPLYSINWSKNIYDIYAKTWGFYELDWDALKDKVEELTPSALHCFKNNFLTKRIQKRCVYKPYKEIPPLLEFELPEWPNSISCKDIFRLPIEWQPAEDWGCDTTNRIYDFEDDFVALYKKIKNIEWFKDWQRKIMYLWDWNKLYKGAGFKKPIVSIDNKEVANEYKDWWICDNSEHPDFLDEYFFKKIYSDIKHKSPNYNELYKQITWRTAYSLPVDKDRYIDFMSAIWENVKIKYPYLFRIKKFAIPQRYLDKRVVYTPNEKTVERKLDEILDRKSAQINLLIANNNPDQLDWLDLEIYNYLRIAPYPNNNIDLKAYLRNKPVKVLEIAWERKNMSYYDMLTFSIYWNNLNNPSEKYKYVMKKYLSDQFGWNKYEHPLIWNRKMYEIAYLWEHWDASNMYIKLDPKLKSRHPDFDKIVEKNNILTNNLNNSNIWSSIKEEWNLDTKCSPPEWVPLYKWPSAIKCWIEDMLPPTVKISRWSCWSTWDEWVCIVEEASEKIIWKEHIEKSQICKKTDIEAVNEAIKECDKDDNKNWINDCTEQYLNKVEVFTDNKKYILNSSWKITALLKSTLSVADFLKPFKNILIFDNTTDIEFKLLKVEASKDETKIFSDSNKKTIFDINNPDLSNKESLENLRNYINFYNWKIRVWKWQAISTFSTKNKELDFTFEAFAILPELKDEKRTFRIIKSTPQKIQVRAENIFAVNYLVRKSNNSSDNNNEKIIVDTWIDTVVASDSANIFLSNSKKIKTDKKTIWLDFSSDNWNTNNNTSVLKNLIDSTSTAKEKLVFDLSHFGLLNKELDLDFPLKIKIIDSLKDDEDKKIILEKEININWYFEPIWSINKSGEYILEITDSAWLKFKKEFFVKADIPTRMKVDLSTSIMETWGNITTHLLSLYDKYDNIAAWELYDLEVWIIWNWVKFIDSKLKSKLNIFEGYKNFRLKSTNIEDTNTIQFILKDDLKWINLKVEKELKTLSNLKINVKIEGEKLIVWWKKYNYNIEITKNGQVLTWFNSRAYARFNEIYLRWLDKYVNIKDWKAIGSFETKTVAIKDKKAKIDIKVEWIKDNFIKNTTIYPEVPMKIDYKLSKDKLVVLDDWLDTPIDINTTNLYIELKDRYNNLVFEDKNIENKYEFKLSFLDILDTDIHNFYASTKPKDNPDSKFRDLKWVIQITAKSEPWIWKFLIEVTPKIDWNSFTIKSNIEDEEDIVINWVSETAWEITSYFAWNKNNIKNTKYNSLYTTLLWADYWNISKQDYLAWTLIFEKENRALAVTTLLNSPYKRNNIFNIKKDWNINFVNKNANLWQNIKIKSIFDNNWFSIALFNESINSFIGQIYYYFEKTNIDLIPCKWTGLNFISCKANPEKTSIILKSSKNEYEVVKESKKMILREKLGWKSILEFDENWKITKEIGVELDFSRMHTWEWIAFYIKYNWKIIWVVSFVLKNATIDYSRDENVVSNRLADNKNLIWIYISSWYYNREKNFSWISNTIYDSVSITYNDPFEKKYMLNHFSKLTDDTYESFNNNPWVGWKDWNKTLLSFAAWKNVWEATKDYQSFHLINIWDPVIYLKKIQKNLPKTEIKRQFDATIWKLLLKDDDIVEYAIFDYNNDKIKDIVILKQDWHVKLLEWTKARERFIDKWSIVYFWDIWAESKMIAWDFSGDWFWDLVFTNSEWKLLYVDNKQKNFDRKESSLTTAWKVMQLLSFDMDNDWIDDIVTFDMNWELNIFYWKTNVANKKFTKKNIEKGLWLTLNAIKGSWLWAIYFNWLYQLKQWNELVEAKKQQNRKIIENNKISETLNALKNNNGNDASMYLMQKMDNNKDFANINEDMFNKIIFEKITYTIPWIENNNKEKDDDKWFEKMETNEWAKLDEGDKNLDDADRAEFWEYMSDMAEWKKAFEDLQKFATQKNPGYNNLPEKTNENKKTTFIKSKYAVSEWLQIKKTFIDINWWVLLAWDIVKTKIIIRNTWVQAKSKIAYLEALPELLRLDRDSILVNWKKVKFKKTNSPKYSFLIDSYSLASNSDLIIEYETEVLEYKMWFIKVWKFEKDEVWDDEYWDIIFKNDENNCWEDYSIYRSISSREYKEGTKQAKCEAELPDAMKWNKTDADWNSIPDKYDDLINSALDDDENSKFKKFSEEWLDNLVKDSDWDWIPDLEDSSPYKNDDDSNMLNNLDKFTQQAEKAVDDLEFMIQGFWCWFGWWSCISSPMNRAPLAPWNDPMLFWKPIPWLADWLNTFEWIPVFSLFTLGWPLTITPKWWIWPWVIPWAWNIKFTWPFKYWERVFDWESVVPVPPTWPVNPVWAWGRFWYAPGPVRIFLTPTITWAIWIAICFWDNVWAWYLPTPWLSPIIPGWNCIVAAAPLFGCSDDWSDWNIEDIGSADIEGDSYWVYNWNCNWTDISKKSSNFLKKEDVKNYIKYKNAWNLSEIPDALKNNLKEAFKHISTWWWASYWIPDEAIFKIWNKNTTSMFDLKIDVDPSAIWSWNFRDIIKMEMSSIPSFPEFIMEWVKEQWEEIINYADFPTVTLILPEFSGLLEYEWDNVWTDLLESFSKWKEEEKQRIEDIQKNKIKPLQDKKKDLNCKENNLKCLTLDEEINKLKREQYLWTPRQYSSGIKSVYKFLWSVPIVNIYSQKIFVDIPWIDKATLDWALIELITTKKQWENEIKSAVDNRSMWYYCDKLYSQANHITDCKEEARNKAFELRINSAKLLSSLDKNIEILKSYKEFPEKLQLLVRIKEKRLQQVLCNIRVWSEILPNRLKLNWKRFKTWVELYVLIKAILKSWQILPDLFADYEAECKQCKNERWDSINFIMKLIDMILPKLPIIKLPKMPDVNIDLHNIRAGINIALPEFEFNFIPITFPKLPELYLPARPNLKVNFELPEIPILSDLKIPNLDFIKDLPDLPSLPEIQLPNLPPAPTLPKLFSSIEKFVDILKIISKAMCLLRQNPFVPEWRAGDQIAFITERWGYLPTDFFSIDMPQFSVPVVDSVNITSYVNLEFSTDFVIDLVKNITDPINNVTNNIIDAADYKFPKAFDYRALWPKNIDVDVRVTKDWIKTDIYEWGQKINYNYNPNSRLENIENLIKNWQNFIKNSSEEKFSNNEFKKQFIAWISKLEWEKAKEIKDIWKYVTQKNYSEVDKLNKKLLRNNKEKFEILENIINTEILENKKLEEKLKNYNNIRKLGKLKNDTYFIAKDSNSKIKVYNKKLEKYNLETLENIKNLTKPDKELLEIKEIKKDLKKTVNKWIDNYFWKIKEKEKIKNSRKNKLYAQNNISKKRIFLAAEWDRITDSETWMTRCETGYMYKWIYISEKKKSYRLFDYLDELEWNEKIKQIDFDLDKDDDLLYMMKNQIYLKENLDKKENKDFFKADPIIYDKFEDFSKNIIEAINWFKESISENWAVNIQFTTPTNKNIANFRLEFYPIVDKFDATKAEIPAYIPENTRKYIIDSFVNIDDITSINDFNNYDNFESWYIANKFNKNQNIIYENWNIKHFWYKNRHLAYIENFSNTDWVVINTKKFIKLQVWSKVSAWKKIYTKWNRTVVLKYSMYKAWNDTPEKWIIRIWAHTSVNFTKNDIEIDSITGWDIFIVSEEDIKITWQEALEFAWLPILPDTTIRIPEKNRYSPRDFIKIKFYNDRELDLHFSRVKLFRIRDLWVIKENYLIRLNIENDFYYSKIFAYSKEKNGTSSKQLLISPQKWSDNYAPEISMNSNILIPVYSLKETDITPFIYEDSGIENITAVSLDEKTSQDPNIKISLENWKILLKLWKFDKIIKKKIKILLTDDNNNTWEWEVVLIIYPPVPEVKNVTEKLDKISWTINEFIKEEPINIYRFRWWVLTKLLDKDWKEKVYTNEKWEFEFLLNSSDNQNNYEKNKVSVFREIFVNWKIEEKEIAFIDEKTWKITPKEWWISIKVLASNNPKNNKAYLKTIITKDRKEVYYNYIVAPNTWKVQILSDINNVFWEWVFVEIIDKTNYSNYMIPVSAEVNPWALIIYNINSTKKEAIFTIFRDWRINIIWWWVWNYSDYKINYSSIWKYPVFELMVWWNIIAKVIIKTKWNYIIR